MYVVDVIIMLCSDSKVVDVCRGWVQKLLMFVQIPDISIQENRKELSSFLICVDVLTNRDQNYPTMYNGSRLGSHIDSTHFLKVKRRYSSRLYICVVLWRLVQ
jgi:hypothetical protein